MQWLALSHAKSMDSNMAATSGYHIVLIKRLELQLLDLIANFSQWLNAQRKYATYLNEWLKKGIEYEPEVTDDGVPPFSPGRLLGALPINMERISEAKVVGAMQVLTTSNGMSLWEHQRSEWRKVANFV